MADDNVADYLGARLGPLLVIIGVDIKTTPFVGAWLPLATPTARNRDGVTSRSERG